MKPRYLLLAALWIGPIAAPMVWAGDTTPQALAEHWNRQAGTPGNATRGQQFFKTQAGGDWSCASCHGDPPSHVGKHASTGKAIQPLAPSVNPQRLTDTAKVDKWLRRNCNDVLRRACTAQETADFIAYLLAVKP